MLPGGYCGKLLRIDLSSREISVEQLDEEVVRNFVGGTGLGIKYLFAEVDGTVGPLDERNRLIFATGPLTGSGAPGTGNYSVITLSPLSGFAVSAQSNGYWGPTLKKAGFDALLIQGRAECPVYLLITDGEAQLLDAGDLWGLDAAATEEVLKNRHRVTGRGEPRVACIGPAGENGVSFACIYNDRGHVAASGGVGAVMGAKKLKAIVVSGRGEVPVYDKVRFRAAVKKWLGDAKASGTGLTVHRLGTAGLFTPYYKNGWVPVKNLTTESFPAYERFDGLYLRQVYPGKRGSCFACPMDHCRRITIPDGKYAGLTTEEPEYEGLAAWGPNIGNEDPAGAIYLNDLVDRLGMDLKEATFLVSLLMECREAGLLTPKRLDGIDLKWGDVEAVAAVLHKVARAEGVGKILRRGVLEAARWIGRDALQRAVYVKRGYAPHVHDLRARWGTLFTQAISQMGSQQGIDLSGRGSPDLGIAEPTGFSPEKVVLAEVKTGKKRQFEDCLGVCYLVCRGPGGLSLPLEALNAITGWDLSVEDALTIGERVINLLKLFNIRFGHTAADDDVSPRLLEPPGEGPGSGMTLAPHLAYMKRLYYQAMGWDPETGVPLTATLARLGLNNAECRENG